MIYGAYVFLVDDPHISHRKQLLNFQYLTLLQIGYTRRALWKYIDSVVNMAFTEINRLFSPRSKKSLKLCVPRLCERNSPMTGEFHAERTTDRENVSIWSTSSGLSIFLGDRICKVIHIIHHCTTPRNQAICYLCLWLKIHTIHLRYNSAN